MSDSPVRGRLRLVVEALRLVAADADVQVSVLPSFVNPPDDMAEDFEHACRVAGGLHSEGVITQEQMDQLSRLDAHFIAMNADKSLWTVESLATHPVWQEARVQARNILDLMGYAMRAPTLSWTPREAEEWD